MSAQQFSAHIRKAILARADEVQGECDKCNKGGSILIGNQWEVKKCPTCQPEANRLRELAGKYCWHEVEEYFAGNLRCRECNAVWSMCDMDLINPTYTVEKIRQGLEDAGVWDRFAGTWLWDKSQMLSNEDNYYDILTDPTLLLQAANSFMEVNQ